MTVRAPVQGRRLPWRVLTGAGILAGLLFAAYLAWAWAICACSTPTMPPSPVEGVVVAVDSAGLGQVKGFSLRTPDRVTLTLVMGALENAAEFSPSHLAEHQVSSEPVRVSYRVENGVLVVYRLEDVPRDP